MSVPGPTVAVMSTPPDRPQTASPAPAVAPDDVPKASNDVAEQGQGAQADPAPDDITAARELSWNPDDEVTVDVIESVLGDLIGHASAALWEAEHAPDPDARQIAACRQRISDYAAAANSANSRSESQCHDRSDWRVLCGDCPTAST